MFKLILEQEYIKPKLAVDTSRFMRHGKVVNVLHNLDGRTVGSGAMKFFAPDSEIRVSAGSPWIDLSSIAIEAWVKIKALPGQRQNIIEGDSSFALFVDPSGAVVASFFGLLQGQSTMQWNSVSTANHSPSGATTALQTDVWTLITLVFDGIGRARIWIDDTLVAIRTDFASGVSSVKSSGVVIGNWTLRNQYWLNGEIDSIRVWKEDPTAPIAQFVSRLKENSKRQTWDKFFDCLARTSPDSLEQYANLLRELDALLRLIVIGMYGVSEEQRKEFFALLRKYLDDWKNNNISSDNHVTNLLALKRFMESFGGDAFSEQIDRSITLISNVFENEGKCCIQNADIEKIDLEFVSFIQKAVAQISE